MPSSRQGRVISEYSVGVEKAEADDLPEPDAAVVLWRVSVQAFIATAPRRRSERFLKAMAETLASEDAVSDILPIRPRGDHAAVQRARREAVAAFRQLLPAFLAALPPK